MSSREPLSVRQERATLNRLLDCMDWAYDWLRYTAKRDDVAKGGPGDALRTCLAGYVAKAGPQRRDPRHPMPELPESIPDLDAALAAREAFEAWARAALARLDSTPPPESARNPPRRLSDTERSVLAHCRRHGHTGERIAHHLGLSTDHVRRLLARLVREGRLRKTADGYRTARAT